MSSARSRPKAAAPPQAEHLDGIDAAAEGRQSLRVWLHLMKCSRTIESVVAGRLRRTHNQSFARFDVLSQLYRVEGSWLAVGELARLLMASSGNITALLDRMEAERLIERRASPSDRRSFQVRMTPAGRKTFLEMNRDHIRWIDSALAELPDRDKETLVQLLVRVRRAFEGA